MKHCQPCNFDFPDDRRFCGSCGGPLINSTTCEFCGDVIESKWKFCTGCGNTLTRGSSLENPHHQGPSVESSWTPEWYAAPELLRERDETTVESRRPNNFVNPLPPPRKYSAPLVGSGNGESRRNGKDVPTLSMLSAYGDSEPMTRLRMRRRYSIVLSLTLIAFFVIVSFGGWYVWAHRASARSSRAELPTGEEQSAMGNQSSARVDEAAPNRGGTENADDLWKRLKQERIKASPSEWERIIAALEQAEERYPRDYRFPYERAKLSIKGVTSHHEAFAALATSAEKAIENGKAQEMLDTLLADQDGDFWKPSHGHHEWQTLLAALEHQDKERLAPLRN